jgi:hypothetical protein
MAALAGVNQHHLVVHQSKGAKEAILPPVRPHALRHAPG